MIHTGVSRTLPWLIISTYLLVRGQLTLQVLSGVAPELPWLLSDQLILAHLAACIVCKTRFPYLTLWPLSCCRAVLLFIVLTDCAPLCAAICPTACPAICPAVCLAVCPAVCPTIWPAIWFTISLLLYSPVLLFIVMTDCTPLCLAVCPAVCPTIWPAIWFTISLLLVLSCPNRFL